MGLTFNLGRVSPSVFTDSSLNVGIGAAPSGTYKLEVTGTAKVSSTLLVSGLITGSSGATISGVGGANPLLLTNTDYNTGTSTGSSMRLRLGAASGNTYSDIQAIMSGGASLAILALNPSGGNVGIGTTSPATLLNIKSSTTTELRLESVGGTYRSFIGFRTDGQKWDLGVNLNDTSDALSFNYAGSERIKISTAGNTQINGPVYRYSGQNVVGGSFTNLTAIDLSSSRTYLIQMIPTNTEAGMSYRIFGVIQANATSGTYVFSSIHSQTMDITFSGTTVQARVTNGQQWTFNWSITQLL